MTQRAGPTYVSRPPRHLPTRKVAEVAATRAAGARGVLGGELCEQLLVIAYLALPLGDSLERGGVVPLHEDVRRATNAQVGQLCHLLLDRLKEPELSRNKLPRTRMAVWRGPQRRREQRGRRARRTKQDGKSQDHAAQEGVRQALCLPRLAGKSGRTGGISGEYLVNIV